MVTSGRMQHLLLILLLVLSSRSCCTAMRQPLSTPANPLFQQLQQQVGGGGGGQQQVNSGGGQGSGSSSQQDKGSVQPTQHQANGASANPLFQQLQQQVSGGRSNSSSGQEGPTALKPTEQFVTLEQQQRPPALKQAEEEQRKQQQASQQAQPNPENFKCGAPFMPCGSAIPDGKKCDKGPGWCEPGHYCGYEATTSEPSRCLPLPKDCGKAGNPCCPSNKDTPHSSSEDKLSRKPFCTDGSTCFYFAPVPGFNNGDTYAANKGAYACTAVADDCGMGPGKPCCPFAYKVATNPPLKRTGCADDMFCNYDFSAAAAAEAQSIEHRTVSVPGTCERNTADCGQFSKGCCIATSPSSTSMTCGARWNETGQRGYCADPFDSNNSAGPAAAQPMVAAAGRRRALLGNGGSGSSGSGSSNGGGGNGSSISGGSNGSSGGNSSKKRARLNQLVCTPCPPRTDNVANNPSKYWPC